MSESMRERVIRVLGSVVGPDADLDHTRLELESLKMLELVVGLENEFGILIPEDAPLARVTASVDAIVKFLATLGR